MLRPFSVFALLAVSAPAWAQRTTDNAVTAAGDAFGKTVGSEKIGLYNAEDVRGFNPIDAGNARIEGLYFIPQDRLPTRTVDGSTIRVGITAQGYSFPAPTGIVDYRLVLPDAVPSASIEIERGPFGGQAGSIEAKLPIDGARLGLAAGIGGRRQFREEGGIGNFRSFDLTLAWHPYDGAQVIGFVGGFNVRGDEARVTAFPGGAFLPPRIARRQFFGQEWTDRSTNSLLEGLIVKLPFGVWRAEAGLFRSRKTTDSGFADLLLGVQPDGRVTERRIIVDGNNLDDAVSGEFKLTRAWQTGTIRHSLTASLRGRSGNRRFGGTQRISLGASTAIAPDPRPKPGFVLGPDDNDKVRQFTAGLAYGLNWQGKGALDLSLAKSRYRKTVDFANPALPTTVTRDDPLLFSATGSISVTPGIALYGGYVRGLEEAIIAPDIAVNRSEAPPAIRTRQIDAGIRFAITPKLTLVVGVFSVKKPYFNIDPALRFRQLGTVDNRGIEVSLAGTLAKGVTIVAGSLFLDPVISGEDVTAGRIGVRPVGSLTRRSIANVDWRPGGDARWSFDLALESLSARTANAANSLTAPSRETAALGTRYRFRLRGESALVRVQVTNLFDDYGYQVSSSGGFTYTAGRTYTAQLIVDL